MREILSRRTDVRSASSEGDIGAKRPMTVKINQLCVDSPYRFILCVEK
jgi:hypothetical protein